jgi:hypothetical protein
VEWLRRDAGYTAWYVRASSVTRGLAPDRAVDAEQ